MPFLSDKPSTLFTSLLVVQRRLTTSFKAMITLSAGNQLNLYGIVPSSCARSGVNEVDESIESCGPTSPHTVERQINASGFKHIASQMLVAPERNFRARLVCQDCEPTFCSPVGRRRTTVPGKFRSWTCTVVFTLRVPQGFEGYSLMNPTKIRTKAPANNDGRKERWYEISRETKSGEQAA